LTNKLARNAGNPPSFPRHASLAPSGQAAVSVSRYSLAYLLPNILSENFLERGLLASNISS